MSQRLAQLYRQRRRDELRQDFLVRQIGVDNVLQSVVVDELIEIRGRNDHCARHENPYVGPFVIEVVFLQHMVEERQSSTLSTHCAFSYAGKPNRVIIRVGGVFGNDAKRLIDSVVVNKADIGLTDVFYIRLVLDLQRTYGASYGE